MEEENISCFFYMGKLSFPQPFKSFCTYKNSTEILNKLKTKGFQASTISTYDFSTLYTTLPYNLIRNQLVDLIENTFRREEALYLACNEERAFFRFRRT